MASTKVRGITIELSADASGVSDAFSKINKSIQNTSADLRDIEKLLKLDPTNTELLEQKQKALATQLTNTRDKLDALKQAEKDLNEQMKDGATEEQERQLNALRREIESAEIDTKKYEDQLKQTDKALEDVGKGTKDAGDKTGKFKEVAEKAGKAIAASFAAIGAAMVAVGKGLADMVTKTAEYGDNVDKMSQKMGVSAEAYQEWDFVMQHCGTSMDSLKASMKTLSTAAETGNKAFEKLGITQEEIASLSQEDLFAKTIEGLQGVEDTTERTYLAGQLLGRGATELGALLNMSAEDTANMKQQVHELGGVMSDEAVKASAQFKDNLQDLQTALNGFSRNISAQFLPAVNEGLAGVTEILKGNTEEGLEMLDEATEELVERLNEIMPTIIEVGGNIILSLILGIVENLPELIPAILDVTMQIVDALIENLPLIIDAAVQIIVAIATGIADKLPDLIPTIIDVVITICEALIDHADEIIIAAADLIVALAIGLVRAIPLLIQRLPEIISAIVQAVKDGAGEMASAGKALLDGLWQGIVNNAQRLWQNISNWLSNLWSDILGFFGIHSPSKKMAWVGEMLGEGMSIGIDDSADEAIKSAENMVEGIDGTIANGLAGLSDASIGLNGSYDAVVNASGTANNPSINSLNNIMDILRQYMPMMANMQMILDSGELVGAIAPKMSNEFGSMQRLAIRGV